jgi:hypothetical protein
MLFLKWEYETCRVQSAGWVVAATLGEMFVSHVSLFCSGTSVGTNAVLYIEHLRYSSQAAYSHDYAISDTIIHVFVIVSVPGGYRLILSLPYVCNIILSWLFCCTYNTLLFTNVCRHGYYRYVGLRMISCMNGVVCLAICCCYCNQCGYRSHREDA